MGEMIDGARRRTLRAATQSLESLAAAGITHLPKPRPRRPKAAQSEQLATPPVSAPVEPRPSGRGYVAPIAPQSTQASEKSPPPAVPEDRAAALQVLNSEVIGCLRCAELCSTRTQTVFGVGNPQARLCFLGEAPGADEDARGEPFVGRAGQLLNKIIEACTLKREDVYILNVLKCRPPSNRTPAPDEVTNCRSFLNRQLAIIRPEFICCLGAVAARTLLNTESSMAKLRGRFYLYEGIEVLCTYHPAYLLRNPAAKKDVWEDMKLLMPRLGIKL